MKWFYWSLYWTLYWTYIEHMEFDEFGDTEFAPRCTQFGNTFFTHGAVCGWSLRDRLPSRRSSWLEAPTWSQPKTSGVQAVTVLGLNSYWRWWKQQLLLLYINCVYIYTYIGRLLRGARTAWAVRRSTRWSCRQGQRWNNLLNIHTKGSWKSLPSATFHVYATSCWQTLTVWVEAAWVGCSESRLKIKEVQICC